MQSRTFIWLGLAVGSTIGGYIPTLWGDSFFSLASIVLSALGGIGGIWLGFKFTQTYL